MQNFVLKLLVLEGQGAVFLEGFGELLAERCQLFLSALMILFAAVRLETRLGHGAAQLFALAFQRLCLHAEGRDLFQVSIFLLLQTLVLLLQLAYLLGN